MERATQRLREAWGDTRKAWDDPVADDFEVRQLEPIMPQLRFTAAAIRQLSDTFAQAARECSDPEAAP